MTRQVLILEPSLVDAQGHHSCAALRFASLIGDHNRSGHRRSVIAAGAAWAGAGMIEGTPVRPLFKHHRQSVSRLRRYGGVAASVLSAAEQAAAPLATLLRRQRTARADPAAPTAAAADAGQLRSVMAADLKQCLSRLGADASDLVFIPSADAEMILAVAELLTAETLLPPVHLRLMYDDIGSHHTDPTWRSALRALDRVRRGARTPVHVLAETNAFADAIQAVWHDPVAVLPHPSAFRPSPPPPLDDVFTLYSPGQLRTDKGLHLVQALTHALAAKLPAKLPAGLRICLLVHGGGIESAGAVSVESLPAHAPEASYARLWQRAHASLFLHDPRIYALRGSGVVCDAVASGRPFVYLNGASLGEWGGFGNAVAAAADAGAIADAVCQLIANYGRCRTASAIAAATFPDRIERGLRGLAGGGETNGWT